MGWLSTSDLLAIALLVEGWVVVALWVSAVHEASRIWPPGEVAWRFWFYWGAVGVVGVSMGAVGILEADPLLDTLLCWLGVGMVVTGLAVGVWAARQLRLETSVGLAGELHTEGPYRYSRNPQLVGIAVALVGAVLVVNARAFTVGVLPTFLWLWLLPRAEEPWLQARFGAAYERYREDVPRFVGWRSIRRLWA
jgi:protein-S-isoprenylcysteine O-methyltransferase Ste14